MLVATIAPIPGRLSLTSSAVSGALPSRSVCFAKSCSAPPPPQPPGRGTQSRRARQRLPPLQRAAYVRNVFHGLSAADADLHGRLREVPGVEREAYLTALARTQVKALESAQTSYRSF